MPVFPEHTIGDDGYWNDLQADDALVVRLDGGYGMAIDPMGRHEYERLTFLLCAECTKTFAAENPWLASAFAVVNDYADEAPAAGDMSEGAAATR